MDVLQPPEFISDESIIRNILVKDGDQIKMQLSFIGRPAPTVSWIKLEEKVPSLLRL